MKTTTILLPKGNPVADLLPEFAPSKVNVFELLNSLWVAVVPECSIRDKAFLLCVVICAN